MTPDRLRERQRDVLYALGVGTGHKHGYGVSEGRCT
jgi:hypothetical protein